MPVYVSVNDRSEASFAFHGASAEAYKIDAKSTARPLFTLEEVAEKIATARNEKQ